MRGEAGCRVLSGAASCAEQEAKACAMDRSAQPEPGRIAFREMRHSAPHLICSVRIHCVARIALTVHLLHSPPIQKLGLALAGTAHGGVPGSGAQGHASPWYTAH